LLWQSVYTFDDFTMSVTTDLTLANLKALFNPANYDIIVRTLVMALSVTWPARCWLCRWRGIWPAIPAAK
jgi:ABC-type spermidine/putrescine transport system permease subunit I